MHPAELDTTAELGRIAERVRQLFETAFATGRTYLLSRLGVDLGKDVQTLKLLGFKGLADFMRRYPPLAEDFALVPVVGSSNVLAVVRKRVFAGGSEVLDEPPVVLAPRPTQDQRYHYRFWAAFSVPAATGRRFLNPIDFFFKAVTENEPPPDGWLLIDDECIASPNAENRDRVIKDNIARWLEKNGLERSKFLQDARPASAPQQTLLSALVDALDRRQLQATTMTLDVVATLLAKKL